VIRVWAFGDGPEDASEYDREHALFRAGPRGWREGACRHLDHVLFEARSAACA
jgi:hypothetical protein